MIKFADTDQLSKVFWAQWAGCALQGILASHPKRDWVDGTSADLIARAAAKMADAQLAEFRKRVVAVVEVVDD